MEVLSGFPVKHFQSRLIQRGFSFTDTSEREIVRHVQKCFDWFDTCSIGVAPDSSHELPLFRSLSRRPCQRSPRVPKKTEASHETQ